MLFKPTIGSSQSGAMGGIVASRNASGTYYRQRAMPVNPRTPNQVIVRNAFSTLANLWTGLTGTQLQGYADLGSGTPIQNRIGDTINIPGLPMFQRINVPRVQSGLPIVTDAPIAPASTPVTPLPAPLILAAGSPGTFTFSFTVSDPWVSEDDAAMLLFLSRPQSRTVNFFKGPYNLAATVLGDATTPPTSPVTGSAPLASPWTSGQRVFFRLYSTMADGSKSTPVDGFADVP